MKLESLLNELENLSMGDKVKILLFIEQRETWSLIVTEIIFFISVMIVFIVILLYIGKEIKIKRSDKHE